MGIKIPGGSVRGAKDPNVGGAMTTSSGKGTEAEPNVKTTTQVSPEGDVTEVHNTVTVDGKKGEEKHKPGDS